MRATHSINTHTVYIYTQTHTGYSVRTHINTTHALLPIVCGQTCCLTGVHGANVSRDHCCGARPALVCASPAATAGLHGAAAGGGRQALRHRRLHVVPHQVCRTSVPSDFLQQQLYLWSVIFIIRSFSADFMNNRHCDMLRVHCTSLRQDHRNGDVFFTGNMIS